MIRGHCHKMASLRMFTSKTWHFHNTYDEEKCLKGGLFILEKCISSLVEFSVEECRIFMYHSLSLCHGQIPGKKNKRTFEKAAFTVTHSLTRLRQAAESESMG